LLPLGAAFHRSWRGDSYRYLLPLYLIFLFYGFARTVSFVRIMIRMFSGEKHHLSPRKA
jgi:hypothetical protein